METDVVCDACAILSVLLNEEEGFTIREKVEGMNLFAPTCLNFEIGNALSSLMKRKALSVVDAVTVYHEFLKIPMKEIDVDVPYALIIAGEDTMYAYDAYYIACALRYNLPILTLDKRLIENAEKRGIQCL